MKPLLPSLFTLWRISFPRSAEETKTERGCGDANTWEATLEARAGALGSMGTLVEFCPELIVDELAKRLIVPIETSVSFPFMFLSCQFSVKHNGDGRRFTAHPWSPNPSSNTTTTFAAFFTSFAASNWTI